MTQLFNNNNNNPNIYNDIQQTVNQLKSNLNNEINQMSYHPALSNNISKTASDQSNKLKKMRPMTIKQRILDSYKKNDKENEKNKTKNIKNANYIQNTKNLMRELRDSFVVTYQGKTNFDIFIESVKPKYPKNSSLPFIKLKIIDILNKFKKLSLFGLKNKNSKYGNKRI